MAPHVIVTVPASTANLGPGFDCLGLALGLHNTVEMWAVDPPQPRLGAQPSMQIEVVGEGARQLPQGEGNLILRAAARLFEKAGAPSPPVRVKATNRVPLGSGMGSSAAAVVGGLVAANALLGGPLTRQDLLRLAVEIEGHPDNAAAAIFGGLVIVSASGHELVSQALPTPPLHVAVALPAVRLSTAEARAALPQTVPLADAVFNVGRAALVVKALERCDYDLLRWAMADRLHQPYRKRLIPGCDEVMAAARLAGAAAVALSGAGPGLIAFAPDGHQKIAQAMAAAFDKAGVTARTFVLPVDRQGVTVSMAGRSVIPGQPPGAG